MDQILMQQQLSFDYKLNNINQVNSTLDKLQKKMNSYFQKSTPDHMSQNAITRYTIEENNDLGMGIENQVKKNFTANNIINERQRISTFNYQEGNNLNNKRQLQFKLYKNSGKEQQINLELNNKNINPNNYAFHREAKQKQRGDNERLSQTTIQKISNVSQNPQNRSSSNVRSRKNNDEFRLIGKSRNISVDRNAPQVQHKEIPIRSNMATLSNQKQKYQQYHRQSYLKQQEDQINGKFQSINKLKQNNPLASNYSKSRNNLVHEMETIELLMKERLQTKQRNLKHIEQEIMTENQQRVYLYKINVRLNQQLKLLQQQDNINQQQNNKNLQWNIKRLEEDVNKLKKQITKKKNERKQLKKEQQTLKDGYQIVLNNKKSILRKDIQTYINKQNKATQNTQMLKGLIKELQKLKGVVEDKIKSSILTTSTGKPLKYDANKRKVIKSFKV